MLFVLQITPTALLIQAVRDLSVCFLASSNATCEVQMNLHFWRESVTKSMKETHMANVKQCKTFVANDTNCTLPQNTLEAYLKTI